VLVVDAPRGLDLERIGNLVRRLLGKGTPIVYMHYPRRSPIISDAAARRAFKPVNAAQLWNAMAGIIAPGETKAEEMAEAAPPLPATPEVATAGRLLVAEDDTVNARLIASLLRRAGCEVTLVRDGGAALQAASSQEFDLAFIDLRMPVMDGIDFTRAYRAQEEAGRHLPIIAITANAAEETRAQCLRAGMDEFVIKPIDPAIIEELIQRYGGDVQPDRKRRLTAPD
jgi:two-component system sensor histidine kinase RpfC